MAFFGSSWLEDSDDWDGGIKHFSECSGPCEDCYSFYGSCIAGHGDDHFHRITESDAKHIIKIKREYGDKDLEDTIKRLKEKFPNLDED